MSSSSTARLVRILKKVGGGSQHRTWRARDIRAGKGEAVAWTTVIGSAPDGKIDVSSAFVSVEVPDSDGASDGGDTEESPDGGDSSAQP